jgi:hypothetical protein
MAAKMTAGQMETLETLKADNQQDSKQIWAIRMVLISFCPKYCLFQYWNKNGI